MERKEFRTPDFLLCELPIKSGSSDGFLNEVWSFLYKYLEWEDNNIDNNTIKWN